MIRQNSAGLRRNVSYRSPCRGLAWGRAMIGWCCLSLLSATSVCAQDALACPSLGSDPKGRSHNEVGLNVLGLIYFNYDRVYPNPGYSRLSVLNGVSFKRRTGRNAYRMIAEVFRDEFEKRHGEISKPLYFAVTGSGVRTEARVGFERQFASGKFRPYGAIDLFGTYERLRLTGEGWGDPAWQPGPEPYAYDVSSTRYGVSASIGLSWKLSKHFSCSAENSWAFVLIEHGSAPYWYRSRVYVDPLRSFSFNYHW